MTHLCRRHVKPWSSLRAFVAALLLALAACVLASSPTTHAADSGFTTAEVTAARFFDPLQHNVVNLAGQVADGTPYEADFLDNFTTTGGIERWGYPTSAVFEESPGTLTQYYQRGVVDWQPPPGGGLHSFQRRLAWDYLGGGLGGSTDLGVELHLTNPNPGDEFGPWGHKVANASVEGVPIGFADFFHRLGGIASFGFPKTDARRDTHPQAVLHTPGRQPDDRIRQYFQSAVLEYHPESPASPVKLSLLGDTLRDHRYPRGFWQQIAAFGPETLLAVGDQFDLELAGSRGIDRVTVDDVARLLEPSLLRVRTDQACGSGFFVTATGYAVTTWQVVADAVTISVDSPRGYSDHAYLVAGDPDRDVALIKVPGDHHIPVSCVDIPRLPFPIDLVALGHSTTRLVRERPVDCQSPPTATTVTMSSVADPTGPVFLPSIDAGSAGGALATPSGLVAGLIGSAPPRFPQSDRFTPGAAIRPLIDTWIDAVDRGTPPALPHRPRFEPSVLFESDRAMCPPRNAITVEGSEIEVSTTITLTLPSYGPSTIVINNPYDYSLETVDRIHFGTIYLDDVRTRLGWTRRDGDVYTTLRTGDHEAIVFGMPFHMRLIYDNGLVELSINGELAYQEHGLPYGRNIHLGIWCGNPSSVEFTDMRITGFPKPNA